MLAIIGIFFIIGAAAGMVAVVAMPVLRAGRQRGEGQPEQGPGGPSQRQPDSGLEGAVSGGSSRWPGNDGHRFAGR